MVKFELENKYKNFIIKTIENILPDVDIFIYGSRVKGNSKEYSDVDIALQAKIDVPPEKIFQIKAVFHDSTFPYKVDVIDLNSISESFFNIIKDDLVRIN